MGTSKRISLSRKRNRLTFAKITSQYVGKPYAPGAWDTSYDCGSFLISILEKLGHKFDGSPFSRDKYNDLVTLWDEDRDKAIDVGIRYLEEHGDKIEP